MHRRNFLVTGFLAALVPAFRPARAEPSLPGRGPSRPAPEPGRLASGHYLVEGWVLSAADLRALGIVPA